MAKSIHWFWLAVVAALLATPNATIIRVAVNDADPLYWTISRFALIALVCLPFVLRAGKVLRKPAARRELAKASAALTVAMLSYVFAIYYSQASYVSIVTLLTPKQLSPAMVIGGALILLGVYVVEAHKHPHIKHHLIHHNY